MTKAVPMNAKAVPLVVYKRLPDRIVLLVKGRPPIHMIPGDTFTFIFKLNEANDIELAPTPDLLEPPERPL